MRNGFYNSSLLYMESIQPNIKQYTNVICQCTHSNVFVHTYSSLCVSAVYVTLLQYNTLILITAIFIL